MAFRGVNALKEMPDSPEIVLGDRGFIQQKFHGPWSLVRAYALSHPRGASGTVDGAACFVEDCTAKRKRGDVGEVVVKWCRLDVVPYADFAITPFEQNPRLETNPFFSSLSKDDVKRCRMAFKASNPNQQSQVDTTITASTNGVLARKLLDKWLAGIETYYLAGIKFQTFYHYASITGAFTTLGGFIEEPFGVGSTYLPESLAYLRQADELSSNNGIFKLTRTWLGGFGGSWDPELYS